MKEYFLVFVADIELVFVTRLCFLPHSYFSNIVTNRFEIQYFKMQLNGIVLTSEIW